MNQNISKLLNEYEATCLHLRNRHFADPEMGALLINAIEMIDKLRTSNFPPGKWNRWLGYIQGILHFHGSITMEEIRDRTRPIAGALEDWEELIKS